MNIAIIGSGNVATVLGRTLKAAGHTITQLFSHHNKPQAQVLAAQLEAEVITDFLHLDLSSDIFLLAVSDGALSAVVQNLPVVSGIVLHTAGSVSIHVLKKTASFGVLYPLQSLRKEKANYENIPLLVDGNTEKTLNQIKKLAGTISSQVQIADDDYRLRLHTAAVVVSNFTNHLYSLAAHYCQQEGVDFHLLQPLISETANRLQWYAPAQMQTGPAIRDDVATVARHLELLQAYPQLQKLYDVITGSIQLVNSEK